MTRRASRRAWRGEAGVDVQRAAAVGAAGQGGATPAPVASITWMVADVGRAAARRPSRSR